MMITRRFVALLTALLLALGMTACGGEETTTDDGTGDTIEDDGGTGTDGTMDEDTMDESVEEGSDAMGS